MTAIAAFNPPPNSPQQFQATLDGTVYVIRIPWNLYRRGWYVETRSTAGALLYNAALVGSPPAFDLGLTLPSLSNKLVYRAESGTFEVV